MKQDLTISYSKPGLVLGKGSCPAGMGCGVAFCQAFSCMSNCVQPGAEHSYHMYQCCHSAWPPEDGALIKQTDSNRGHKQNLFVQHTHLNLPLSLISKVNRKASLMDPYILLHPKTVYMGGRQKRGSK